MDESDCAWGVYNLPTENSSHSEARTGHVPKSKNQSTARQNIPSCGKQHADEPDARNDDTRKLPFVYKGR